MPELPADLRCRHCATSSKLVTGFLVRITPTGWPVQCTTPSFQLQVSGSQLTLTKSSSPSALQPGPLPSMKALTGAAGSSAKPRTASTVRHPPIPTTTRDHIAVLMRSPQRAGSDVLSPTWKIDGLYPRCVEQSRKTGGPSPVPLLPCQPGVPVIQALTNVRILGLHLCVMRQGADPGEGSVGAVGADEAKGSGQVPAGEVGEGRPVALGRGRGPSSGSRVIISRLKRISGRAVAEDADDAGQVEDARAERDLGEQEPVRVFLDGHVLEVGRERPAGRAPRRPPSGLPAARCCCPCRGRRRRGRCRACFSRRDQLVGPPVLVVLDRQPDAVPGDDRRGQASASGTDASANWRKAASESNVSYRRPESMTVRTTVAPARLAVRISASNRARSAWSRGRRDDPLQVHRGGLGAARGGRRRRRRRGPRCRPGPRGRRASGRSRGSGPGRRTDPRGVGRGRRRSARGTSG